MPAELAPESTTLTVLLTVPPAPVQLNAYVAGAVSAPVDSLPLAALLPLQPPDATQLVPFAVLHVRVDDPPLATTAGFAPKEIVGGCGGVTVTVTVCPSVLAPEQVNVKLVVAFSGPTNRLPLVGCGPDQPSDATQLVALVDVQLSVVEPPAVTVCGVAFSVTVVTAGPTVTSALWLAVPPAPVQVNVKFVVALSGPVDTLPLVGCAPLQPSEAMQLVALVVLQASVAESPAAMLDGVADSEIVGNGRIVTWTD